MGIIKQLKNIKSKKNEIIEKTKEIKEKKLDILEKLESIKDEQEMFYFIKENKITEIQVLIDDLDLQIFYCFSGFDEECFNNQWLCDLDIAIYECIDRQDTDTKIKVLKHWSDIAGLIDYINRYELLCYKSEKGENN